MNALPPNNFRSPVLSSRSDKTLQRLLCRSLMIMIGIISLLPTSELQADDKAKEIARGLLRSLIESQLERQERESYVPGRPAPPIQVPIPQPQRATPEMLELRQILDKMSLESETLTASLGNDGRRNFEARAHLPASLQFQAAVAAVQQRARRENSHAAMLFSCQTLSQSWKSLAHTAASCQSISRPSREALERLNVLDQRMCDLLGIRESFNQRELVRAADLLAADLKTLSDEVRFLSIPAGVRPGLPNRIDRLHDQAGLFANLAASGARPQNVVSEYQTLYQAWLLLRAELDVFSSRSVIGPVTRLQQTHRKIHQLLRLEFGPDFAMVQRMAANLDTEVSQLFRVITLEHIMLIPDSRALPSQADALSGTCQNLTDIVTRRESLQSIGEAWVFLNEQWNLVEFYVRPISTPDVRRRVDSISQSIVALKNAIGISLSFDPSMIRDRCSELASLADHLNTTVRRWTARTGQQNAALTQKTTQLQSMCNELSLLATGRRRNGEIRNEEIRARCDSIIAVWQEIRPILDSCTTAEQGAIEQTIDRFVPAIVHLRTMVEE